MAEPGLISSYITELRFSVTRLADADDIAEEVEDHLRSAADALVAGGLSVREAEVEALARFGTPSLVGRLFVEESRRGGAVSTTKTRRAGVAAMAAPVLLAVGELGNENMDRGAWHGVSVALVVASLAAFFIALHGIRVRHGGLGGWGRAAFWLFVAAPFISAPAMWAALYAYIAVLVVVIALLGIGMLRAAILPAPAVVLFAFAPLTLPVAAYVDERIWPFTALAAALVAAGLVWVGWAMWREPALDASSFDRRGPLVA